MSIILGIIITVLLIAITIWGWTQPYTSGLGCACAVLGTTLSIVWLTSTLFGPIWNPVVDYIPAKATRLNDVIVVQADGVPTQLVQDIKFLDKEVVIERTKRETYYGYFDTYTYEVKIK